LIGDKTSEYSHKSHECYKHNVTSGSSLRAESEPGIYEETECYRNAECYSIGYCLAGIKNAKRGSKACPMNGGVQHANRNVTTK